MHSYIGFLSIMCIFCTALVRANEGDDQFDVNFNADSFNFDYIHSIISTHDASSDQSGDHENKIKMLQTQLTNMAQKQVIAIQGINDGIKELFQNFSSQTSNIQRDMDRKISNLSSEMQSHNENTKHQSGDHENKIKMLQMQLANIAQKQDVAIQGINDGIKELFQNFSSQASNIQRDMDRKISNLSSEMQSHNKNTKLFSSCLEIKQALPESATGIYAIVDKFGFSYPVFCEMETFSGGWTLVASFHENNIAGKCTNGDRWSSEQGNTAGHPNGDGNWENRNTFGTVVAATSDDYKNKAYFEVNATDLMVLQVPNETPTSDFVSSSLFQYYTTNAFLQQNGGNLFELFQHYPLLVDTYSKTVDNGPSAPVTFARGTADGAYGQFGPASRTEIEKGYIQFRVINHERDAFAFCPGVRVLPNKGDVEHYSIGGTSNHKQSVKHCGDFSSWDWDGYGTHTGHSTNKIAVESTYMILYR